MLTGLLHVPQMEQHYSFVYDIEAIKVEFPSLGILIETELEEAEWSTPDLTS